MVVAVIVAILFVIPGVGGVVGGGIVVKVVVQLRPALPLSFVVMPLILLSFETKICVD